MLRIISFLFFTSFLFAKSAIIFATKAIDKNSTIYLNKPVIFYKNYIIEAKKAIIYKNQKKAILEKDVVVFYKNVSILANRAEIYFAKKSVLNSIFLVDTSNEMWFKALRGKFKKDKVKLKNIIFSSCCIENPDWYLKSSSGSYNKKTKYMKLYNVVLYLHNVPIFYWPFYTNSLDKHRRSGFLRPYVGFSGREGFLYSQPIYFVLGPHADFEITPTIRTFRGRGVYNTFRFLTSPYDFGEIRFGEFIDFDKFYYKYNLAHKKHYGFEILYKRSHILNDKDKLYANVKYANDVDYFYLNAYNYTFDTSYLVDKIVTSKINYITPIGKKYFFGIYNKYFLDTTKISNNDTLQLLPQLNFHKFESKSGYFLNSFDVNYYNYYSKPQKFYQVSLNMPISYYKTLFDGYLKFKYDETFNYVGGNYYNSNIPPQYFYQLFGTFKVYNSLAKEGKNYIHIINPALSINFKQYLKESENNTTLFNYTKMDNSVNLFLYQMFSKEDFTLEHTFNENFDFKGKSEVMENSVNLKKGNVKISDRNRFNWYLKRTTYNSFFIDFLLGSFEMKLSHFYSFDKEKTSSSYTLRLSKRISAYKKYYFEYNYDLENSYYKYFLVGVSLKKRCWQYNFEVKEMRTPVLKENGISYFKNYLVKFNINFYPIGGIKQSIQVE